MRGLLGAKAEYRGRRNSLSVYRKEESTPYSPITLAAATLLRLGRVGVGMARLGEVLGKSCFTLGSAISNAGVVAISELVRASHFRCQYDVQAY
jgi:hypothetical protein